MFNLFKKKKNNSLNSSRNWYNDKYHSVVLQRNFLVLLVLISIVVIISTTLSVIKVTSSKKIEPFVIEIEDKTGITRKINPISRGTQQNQEAINEYFIVKYIRAREQYNKETFSKDKRSVSLMSMNYIHNSYKKFLRSHPDSPTVRNFDSIEVNFKSISKIVSSRTGTSKYSIRFSKTMYMGRKVEKKHYYLEIKFSYSDSIKLTLSEREVNPLGFLVSYYNLTEEIVDDNQ